MAEAGVQAPARPGRRKMGGCASASRELKGSHRYGLLKEPSGTGPSLSFGTQGSAAENAWA